MVYYFVIHDSTSVGADTKPHTSPGPHSVVRIRQQMLSKIFRPDPSESEHHALDISPTGDTKYLQGSR